MKHVVTVWAWVLLGTTACGGGNGAASGSQGGSAAQAGNAGQSSSGSSSGGTTNVSGASAGPTPMEAEVCGASCQKQASCNSAVVETTCFANCTLGDSIFQGDCAAKQLAEFACITDLTCDELAAYADDKLSSTLCGATYREFATSCTLHQGEPPRACRDFCEKVTACDPDARKAAGCSQSCNEALTGYELAAGAACSSAVEALFGCLATVECAVLATALETGLTPPSCDQYDAQIGDACP